MAEASGVEDIYGLLFELSNEDRVRILRQISKEAMNLTQISKELDLKTQEASRHLSRLGKIGLTQKDTEGFHHLTLYGKLTLKQLEGLRFASQHKDYFASHSLEQLPPEFVGRIGDLANSTHLDDVMVAFSNVDRVFGEAEQYILTITDQYLVSTWYPLTTEAIERGVKVKQIEAKDWVVPPKIKESHRPKDLETAIQARVTKQLEEKVLERLDVCLYMSEKEVAVITFPLSDGRFDYLGFTATDKRSCRWCSDLFQFYWEEARNRAKVADELYKWIRKRPQAADVLRSIAAGEEIAYGDELIPELENMYLIRQGQLTRLGDIVYEKLQR